MADAWEFLAEAATGDTRDATQPLGAVRWESAEVTLRRRAPHTISVRVPTWTHHRRSDFVARREWRLRRDGAYVPWGAGLLGAPRLLRGAGAWTHIEVPGWGNLAVLLFKRNTPFAGSWGQDYTGNDADGIIGNQLNSADHGAGGDWFPAAGRAIGTAATTLPIYNASGKSPLEVILDMCDVEGWALRAGIDAAGAFTIKAGPAVEQDRSASLHLIDGANCAIVAHDADDSGLVTNLLVVCRAPSLGTQLNGAHAAGATTLTVDGTAGIYAGDALEVGDGATFEIAAVNAVTSATQLTVLLPLAFAHADNERVRLAPGYFRSTQRAAATGVAQAHHDHYVVLFNDQLTDPTLRGELADAHLAAYDAVLTSATVETTDAALIAAILDAGLEPGDSVKLTSYDPQLAAEYAGATVKVQEMTLSLTPGGCTRIALAVGDPLIDDLAVLERRVAAGRWAATAQGRS
jgi:hypothetical protein